MAGRALSRNVAGSESFRCKVGGEWLPIDRFSKRNQSTLEWKIRNGIKVNPANTGMVCRNHSGEPPTEAKCMGPCNQTRPLADFSKSSRSNEIYWCKQCTSWQVLQEPGITPMVPPNPGMATTEEIDMDIDFGTTPLDSLTQPFAPITEETDGPETGSVVASSLMGTAASGPVYRLPPHLRDATTTYTGSESDSARARPSLPPHLRGLSSTSVTTAGRQTAKTGSSVWGLETAGFQLVKTPSAGGSNKTALAKVAQQQSDVPTKPSNNSKWARPARLQVPKLVRDREPTEKDLAYDSNDDE